MTQFCTFYLGEKTYGLEILSIQEIVRHLEITPVPNSPPFVAGLANLRGQIVVAVDLRNLFGMPRLPRSQDSINIILSSEEESLSLLADRAGEVIDFGDEAMVPPLSHQVGQTSDLIKGVFKLKDTLLNVIDTESIFKSRNGLDAKAAQPSLAGGTDVQ
ncbi:MAG TPA: chemotaxis protein CheW [Fibrobacteria bacterium]|nr:chemotaxis protein CheW [Fibrobacteria bacterium]